MDVSADAVEVARGNAERNHVAGRLRFLQADILTPELNGIGGPFDAVVSNPPYIAAADMGELQEEIRLHEPAAALTDDSDGLTFYRRFAELLPHLLAPNGLLAVEIGYGQSEAVRGIFSAARLRDITVLQDYAGIDRVIVGIMTDGK